MFNLFMDVAESTFSINQSVRTFEEAGGDADLPEAAGCSRSGALLLPYFNSCFMQTLAHKDAYAT